MRDEKYKINEIFRSIQGEGFWSGRSAVFIRFSGCNLKCSFCDTIHQNWRTMTVDQIRDEITLLARSPGMIPQPMIVWTGGEPSLQIKDKDPLFRALKEEGYFQTIETNGTREIQVNFDWITVSPKEGGKYEDPLRGWDEVKIVMADGVDPLAWVAPGQSCHRFVQPLFDGDEPNLESLQRCLDFIKKYPIWRLSLQTHKLIGIR